MDRRWQIPRNNGGGPIQGIILGITICLVVMAFYVTSKTTELDQTVRLGGGNGGGSGFEIAPCSDIMSNPTCTQPNLIRYCNVPAECRAFAW